MFPDPRRHFLSATAPFAISGISHSYARYGQGMAVTTETTRTATYERLIAVLVAVVALAAIVVTAVPSVRLVLGPAVTPVGDSSAPEPQ